MLAKLGQPGVKYLSKTNLPVEVIEVTETEVRLKCLFGDQNPVEVAHDYILKPYNVSQDKQAKENSESKENKDMDTTQTTTKKRGGLSALMDPLFFEGGHTIQEITDLVAQKDPSATEGRNLLANVRVRIAVLKKRGYRIETAENKSIKLVK